MTDWSPEQRANANTIISVGRRMGMDWNGITIALMAAMQESSLRNLNYGDRDSVGLFQQRPSQGWGSVEQILNPVYAATKFYTALKGVHGWDTMAQGAAAQAVQRSAYPDAYAKWMSDANEFVQDALTSGVKITPASHAPDLSGIPAAPAGTGRVSAEQAQQVLAPASGPLSALAATTERIPGLATPLAGLPATEQQIDPITGVPGASGMPTFQSADDFQNALGAQGLSTASGTRNALVNYAKQFLGTPYVWGGTNLQSGVDCSGFVQSVFKHFGVDLPRVSYQQATSGKRVALNKLQPGDLVAWNNSTRNNGADHIAIYIGGGKIIEAPRPGRSVQISNLYDTSIAWGVRMTHF